LNAFSKVDVKVKTCSGKDCLAIHQPFPVDIGNTLNIFDNDNQNLIVVFHRNLLIYLLLFSGLFNVCEKVFISLDIMLEFRDLFKRGHPMLSVIISKLLVLSKKCREVCIEV